MRHGVAFLGGYLVLGGGYAVRSPSSLDGPDAARVSNRVRCGRDGAVGVDVGSTFAGHVTARVNPDFTGGLRLGLFTQLQAGQGTVGVLVQACGGFFLATTTTLGIGQLLVAHLNI